jgi:hypothetical protein
MFITRRLASACVLLTVGFAAHGANPTNAVPTFNIRAACRTLARMPEARLAGVGDADATKNCLADERQARAQVSKEWLKFDPADRRKCVGVSAQGETEPVYTELLTCLEMARDAKEPASTHGPS